VEPVYELIRLAPHERVKYRPGMVVRRVVKILILRLEDKPGGLDLPAQALRINPVQSPGGAPIGNRGIGVALLRA
jgi:hypothetical protein